MTDAYLTPPVGARECLRPVSKADERQSGRIEAHGGRGRRREYVAELENARKHETLACLGVIKRMRDAMANIRIY